MTNFQGNKKIGDLLCSKLALIILFVVLILFTRGMWGMHVKEKETGKKLEDLSAEFDLLVDRRDTRLAEVEKLDSSEGIEDELRRFLPIVREGERVIIITGPEEEEEEPVEETHQNFFYRILNFFGW